MVKDIGESAAKSPGLREVSKINEKNSERDLLKVTRDKFLLSVPIKLTKLAKPPGIRYTGDFQAISLRSWCEFLVKFNLWHILVGLMKPNAERECAILDEFWKRFREWRPNHQIWELAEAKGIDLSRCAPMIFHGDEGRGYRKQGFLVLSFHSAIGRGTQLANASRKSKGYRHMGLNYLGNTWSNRFVTGCLPKMFRDENAFQALMTFVTEDCLDLINKGVRDDSGQCFSMAIIAVSGDWQWLIKAGGLSRNFYHCEKKPRAEGATPVGVCHWCLAGRDGYPFEDSRANASWRTTQFLNNDFPYTSAPVLLQLPHESDKPARLFMYDLFHSYHLGMGKTFLGSALALISEKQPGGNIDLRFQNLTTVFLQWAEDNKITPQIKALSKENLKWPDKKTFPNAQWNKGSTTTTVLKFVVWWLRTHDFQEDPMLVKTLQAAEAINEALTLLYSHDLWLPRSLAHRVGNLGLRHLILFQEMATECFHQKRALWVYMPKHHVIDHIFSELCECKAEFCISPLAYAVQCDEDLVGRVSRLSRRVSPLQSIKQVLERALHASFSHFVDCGYIESF